MTPLEYTPAIWLPLVSAAFMSALAVYLWRRRATPGALPLALGAVVMALICLVNAAEIATTTTGARLAWFLHRDALIVPGAVAALWFALEYAGLQRLLTRPLAVLLAGSAVARVGLTLVDGGHLIWSRLWWDGSTRGELTPLGFAFAAYGWALFLLATFVLLVLFVRSPAHRIPVGLILAGQVALRAVYALVALNVLPDPDIVVVLTLDVIVVMYAIALFRLRLFDLVPAARGVILERMPDAMLVLDAKGRIADLNRAAERMLGTPRAMLLGLSAEAVLARHPGLADLVAGDVGPEGQRTLRADAGSPFQASMTPLVDWQRRPIGRLVLLHDITELRSAQARLVRNERELATATERERMARELHDRVGQVLGYVGLQADATRKLIADGNAAAADRQLARLAGVAREAHADVRAYIAELQAATQPGTSFVAGVRRYLDLLRDDVGLRTELAIDPALDETSVEPDARVSLLRIVRQALANAAVHSRATTVRISLEAVAGGWRIAIEDDGVGFDASGITGATDGHYGLRFMRARAEELGGALDIASAPGRGTQVVVRVPLAVAPDGVMAAAMEGTAARTEDGSAPGHPEFATVGQPEPVAGLRGA